jgi:CheY-like chemotaxis protein
MLIVDDEPAHRQIASVICRRLGHNVTTAADGLEALRLLRTAPFDLVLVDMVMPGLDGWQLLQHLRAAPATAALPIIGLSAAQGPAQQAALGESGLAGWVAKPYDRRTLERAVTGALQAG